MFMWLFSCMFGVRSVLFASQRVEDVTNTKHTSKQPHEHEQAYNVEKKSLNIIHTKMHNPSYT